MVRRLGRRLMRLSIGRRNFNQPKPIITMKISFIKSDDEPQRPTFGDVKDGDFFVSTSGYLYQKSATTNANRIANKQGMLSANTVNFGPCSEIDRILDHITGIEF